jgi:hypothetical protein
VRPLIAAISAAALLSPVPATAFFAKPPMSAEPLLLVQDKGKKKAPAKKAKKKDEYLKAAPTKSGSTSY